jgi:hypothetical protein
MLTARRPRAKDPLIAVALSRDSGRCQYRLGMWDDPHARRCETRCADTSDVYLDEDGSYVVFCSKHRVQSLGMTAGERRVARERLKSAQVPMWEAGKKGLVK